LTTKEEHEGIQGIEGSDQGYMKAVKGRLGGDDDVMSGSAESGIGPRPVESGRSRRVVGEWIWIGFGCVASDRLDRQEMRENSEQNVVK